MGRYGPALLTLAALATAAPAGASEIAVGLSYGVPVASTEVDGCRVSLEHDPRWHTLRYRNRCAAPITQKLAHFADLLAALFADGRLPAELAQLGLGRLVAFPELAARMALAVRSSGDWDARSGRFRSQVGGGTAALNRPLAELLDREGVFRPFLVVLTTYGITDVKSSVEKVLVAPPAHTPIADALLDAGAWADERLPFDAQVWLILKRAASSGQR